MRNKIVFLLLVNVLCLVGLFVYANNKIQTVAGAMNAEYRDGKKEITLSIVYAEGEKDKIIGDFYCEQEFDGVMFRGTLYPTGVETGENADGSLTMIYKGTLFKKHS